MHRKERALDHKRFPPAIQKAFERREFLRTAAAGTVLLALGGGTYVVAASGDPRAGQKRADGRVRLPPGQRLISSLKPMGGEPGDTNPSRFRLKVHGEVDAPLELGFAELVAMPFDAAEV